MTNLAVRQVGTPLSPALGKRQRGCSTHTQNTGAHSSVERLPAIAPQPRRSPPLLAFFALAVDIDQKPFADSLTEKLTNKISRIPGFGVPPPAPWFYFKGKLWPLSHGTLPITIPDVAEVLDASVSKSGTQGADRWAIDSC
jgi:hypothetical protein